MTTLGPWKWTVGPVALLAGGVTLFAFGLVTDAGTLLISRGETWPGRTLALGVSVLCLTCGFWLVLASVLAAKIGLRSVVGGRPELSQGKRAGATKRN